MSNEPLVTVIIPVYNVEGYLDECARSVIAQTYRNIEIIFVDDGSTDGSGALCDELAASDDRITVYHKANGGLSDARNFGLARSHGEWISFVDSDDFVSPIFIEALLCAAIDNNCDIAAVPSGKPFKDGESCELINSLDSLSPANCLESFVVQCQMLYQKLDTGAQWRLYRRRTLGLDPFPRGLYYEDLASVYRIIRKVNKVAVLDCCRLYAYRMRSDSIIRQEYRHIKAESALEIADRLYHDVCEWYPELSDAAASRCFSLCRMVFAQIPPSTDDDCIMNDRKLVWGVLRRQRVTVLRDPNARKRERMAALIACLGEGPFSMFCRVARKFGLLR